MKHATALTSAQATITPDMMPVTSAKSEIRFGARQWQILMDRLWDVPELVEDAMTSEFGYDEKRLEESWPEISHKRKTLTVDFSDPVCIEIVRHAVNSTNIVAMYEHWGCSDDEMKEARLMNAAADRLERKLEAAGISDVGVHRW